MSLSNLEHFSNIISGCESLVAGDGKAPNAVYAMTVLKLHANDAGFYAGQEGFLDHVKKGAKNAKEWFIAFFKALKEFFAKTFRNIVGKLDKLKGSDKERVAETAKTSLASFKSAYDQLDHITEYAGDLDQGYYREILNLKNLTHNVVTLSKDANKHDVDRLIGLVKEALQDGQRLSDRMATDWQRNVEKADQDEHEKKKYNLIGKVGVDVGRAVGFMSTAANLWARDRTDTGMEK